MDGNQAIPSTPQALTPAGISNAWGWEDKPLMLLSLKRTCHFVPVFRHVLGKLKTCIFPCTLTRARPDLSCTYFHQITESQLRGGKRSPDELDQGSVYSGFLLSTVANKMPSCLACGHPEGKKPFHSVVHQKEHSKQSFHKAIIAIDWNLPRWWPPPLGCLTIL